MYHREHGARLVTNALELEQLGADWYDSPKKADAQTSQPGLESSAAALSALPESLDLVVSLEVQDAGMSVLPEANGNTAGSKKKGRKK